MQYYSPHGDFQPILLKCGNQEQKTAVGYDEKFKNFFAMYNSQTEFFWVRKDMPDVKIDGDKTPMELNMKRYDTAEVHARVMKRPNVLANFDLEDKEPQQKKLKEGPEKPVMPEKPAIVEYSTAEYNKDYRMRSGLGYWMPDALWFWMQEKYTPGELGLDPDEVY